MEYKIGDIVELKKQHPCGSKIFEIIRTGVYLKFKSHGCGHIIMLERQKAMKIIKKIIII